MTKKNEISEAKIKTQIDVLLPPERKQGAISAFEACKQTRE